MFKETPSLDNSDIDVPSVSQIPNQTEYSMNISFLCNQNDEEDGLRQPSTSELFGDNLDSVQKQSWAKDSTCE